MDVFSYEKMFTCSATSSKSRNRYSEVNKSNGDWIKRKNKAGDDLSEYKTKMGNAVRASIMSNLAERQRRSDLATKTIGTWARSDIGRKTSSDAAKLTSARPEIIVARTKQLRDWREREPEKFSELMLKNAGYHPTKPELVTLDFVKSVFPDHEFKRNQRLMSREYFHMTQSQKRQIDIMSQKFKIIIEIDGFVHFRNITTWNQLKVVKKKDAELNHGGVMLGYTMIRIAEDQWNNKSELNDVCKTKLVDAINRNDRKLNLIGESYHV